VEETRQEIDQAVNRYSLLMYQWEKNRYELASQNLSHHQANESMISEYGTTDQEAVAGGQMIRVVNRIVFNEFFIAGLMRRTLFNVDWGKVHSIKPVRPTAGR
jgi:hypothetical protein